MLVRVARLYAGVVLLGCLVTVAVVTQLYGRSSVYVDGGLQPPLGAMNVVFRLKDFNSKPVLPSSQHQSQINSSADSQSLQSPHLRVQPVITSTAISKSTSSYSNSTFTHPTHPSSASITSFHTSSKSASIISSVAPPPHSNPVLSHSSPPSLSAEPGGTSLHQTNGKQSGHNMNKGSSALPVSHHSPVHGNGTVSWSTSSSVVSHKTGTLLTAHTVPTTTTIPSHSSIQQGYALAVNYYEQQTMGLRNMMQLQCWAQSLKLQVVQPVMHDSFLRTPLDSSKRTQFLQFEDSFDVTEWNHQAERLGYAPLVHWNKFLAHAPRDVVLVMFEHPSVSMLKSRQKSGQGLLHSPTSLQYTTGCSSKWPTASELNFLKSNGFRVIRTACFNFFYGDQLSLDTFNQHILAGHNPNSVTVIMEMWRGISSAQRVLLKDICQNTALVQEHISLSARLAQQADQYIYKYLAGRPYLAIMGRLEMTQLTVHKKVPVVPFCLEETLSQWRDFRKETHLDSTFLSIDIGRYGSKKYRSRLDPELVTAFRKFFQTLFGTSVTVKEWEKRFELVAGNRDAGYIGLLQKVLVTRAHCILFVGGGAFQRHALYLYKQLHPDPKDQCYHIVKKCTRSNKLS